MKKSPKTNLTLRQAVQGKWQIPLFGISLVAFILVMLQLRPSQEQPSFEDNLADLQKLACENCYHDFYIQAEQLRLTAEDQNQLGQVHGLVAQTRVQQLKQRHNLGLEPDQHGSVSANYENIIKDYREALHRDWIDPNSPASGVVFHDMSLAYWALNESEKAIHYLRRAISVSDKFDPSLHRSLVRMYLLARPKDHLAKCLLK